MAKNTTSTEVPYAKVRDYITSISGDYRGTPIGNLLDNFLQSRVPLVREYSIERNWGPNSHTVDEQTNGVKIKLTTENIKITYKCSTFSTVHTISGFLSGSYSEKREKIKIERKSGLIPYFKTIVSKSERFPHSRGGSLDLGNLDNVDLDWIVKDSLKVLVGQEGVIKNGINS